MGAGQFITPVLADHKKLGHLPAPQRAKPFKVAGFETDETWTGASGSADTINFVQGTQGLKITGGTASSQYNVERVVDMNLYRKDFTVNVYSPDITNIAGLQILFSFGDATFTKYSVWYVTPLASLEWQNKNRNFANFELWGGATLADFKNIKKIRIKFTTGAGGGANVTVDRFLAYDNLVEKGTVLFSFDDVLGNIYTNAKPILDKYLYPASVFMVEDYVGDSGYLTLEQLKILRDQGWTIGSHTKTHANLTSLTDAELATELSSSQTYLNNNGFSPYHKYIAYPFGNANTTVYDATRKLYDIGFITSGLYFTGYAGNRYAIPRVEIKSAIFTVTQLKSLLDTIALHKMCVVLFCHNILDSGGDYTPAEFAEIIDYVATLELDVITVDDLAKMYGW